MAGAPGSNQPVVNCKGCGAALPESITADASIFTGPASFSSATGIIRERRGAGTGFAGRLWKGHGAAVR